MVAVPRMFAQSHGTDLGFRAFKSPKATRQDGGKTKDAMVKHGFSSLSEFMELRHFRSYKKFRFIFGLISIPSLGPEE